MRIFPKEEGYTPLLYLVNIGIPLYFLLQETSARLYIGLLLLVIFVIAYRQAFFRPHIAIYLILLQLAVILYFGFMYNPMYIFMVFITGYQIVRLPIHLMYVVCGLYTVFSLFLVYKTILAEQYYVLINLAAPLFGGSILPFIIKGSIKYKEMSKTLKKTAEELEQKNQEKTRLEESKRRMIADISHDLKTPITTIQGYSKALYEGLVTDEEQSKKYLRYIHDKSVRVTELIDELFMFSKLDTPDFPLYKEEKDLGEFLREVLVENYDAFEEKEMELSVNIPSTRILYSFDKKLFYRAISNIIQNSIKYNPAKTEVYVSLHKNEKALILEIGDNGIGIDKDIASTLFDPFVRGDKSRMNDGGSGLGLAITRKIIEMHGGSIVIDPIPNRGKTNFIMTLPKV